MTFQVRTAVFEGPLDLLLQLISKHHLEVTEIGLTEVVAEYLALLDEMSALDLEVTSEFLLIASTLVQLKARSLLPSGSAVDMDDELAFLEERDRLLSLLLASVTFKDVSAVFLRRLQESNRYVPRTAGLDQKIAMPVNLVDLPVGPDDLALIAQKVLERRLLEPDLDHLDLDLPSVETAISDIRHKVTDLAYSNFEQLTEDCRRPIEVAAYFLALLELARWGLVTVSQADWLADIEVAHGADVDIDLTSEWT